jgi:hypothetical protein
MRNMQMWIRIAKTPFLAWDRMYDRDGHYASLSGACEPTAAAGYVQGPGSVRNFEAMAD